MREPPTIEEAVQRGAAALRREQRPDGRWVSDPDMGPLGLAITVLALAWLGDLSPEEARGGVETLRARQLPDGGFGIDPYATTGTLGATAVCRAALRAAGVPDADPAVRAAEERLRSLGGYPAVMQALAERAEPAAMFCAMAGLVPGSALPPLSPDMAALPWSERFLDGRVHAGVPMVVYAVAAVRERLCGPASLLPSWARGPTRLLARTRLTAFLDQFQNPDGSWNSATFATIFSLVALCGVGHTVADPPVRRGLEFLRRHLRWNGTAMEVAIFQADTWETAFSVLALRACGAAEDDTAVLRGVEHLLRAQCRGQQPRCNQPKAGAPRTGGWAFQLGNDTMPDCDDTAVALAALGGASGPRPTRAVHAAVGAGLAWMRGMQNEGGGVPTYAHGLPAKPPGAAFLGPIPLPSAEPTALLRYLLAPPPELGDPPTADVAGRALWAFGLNELGPDDPMVAELLRFLERDVCTDGSFWGVWSPPYVVPTAFVLIGVASVRASLHTPLASRALDWLLDHQNEDGGWGETVAAFRDPSLAGRGPSMAPPTGVVLRALSEITAAGHGSPRVEEAAERAARWLAHTQLPDGGWSDGGWLFTIVPPTFYNWPLARLYYVLIGLGRWAEVRAGLARD